MHAQTALVLALQAAASVLASPVTRQTSPEAQLEALFQSAKEQTEAIINGTTDAKRSVPYLSKTCNPSNVRVRKEWNALTKKERKAYVDAVTCLVSIPAKTPSEEAPGAKVRLDDFVATHINQTQTIHYTGNFLSWHRQFTWLHENALREECGYTGTTPYWDWTITARNGLVNSSMVDGSEYSMGGQGEFIPDQPDILLGASQGLPPIVLPPGTGGGCVTSGPFSNMSVNLGPVSLDVPGNMTLSNPDGPLAYNPRCLKRDLTNAVNERFSNTTGVLDLIINTDNVYDFQMQMQGVPGSGDIGVHGGGHYSMGGDPGRDVSTSPGEPLFFLHHAMIDRTWWIWQMLDLKTRAEGATAVNGTNTFLDSPPSNKTLLTDYVWHGYSGGDPNQGVQIGDLLKIWEGPYCYIYV